MNQPLHLLEAERQVGNSQSLKARGNLCPRDGILYQTVSRLPITNQVFLGSWTVDICPKSRSQRSAPQRRHMAHLRWHSCCAARKLSDWDRGEDKMHHPAGRVRSSSIRSPELLGLGKSQLSLCLCGVPENLNLSGLDLGSAHNQGPALNNFPAEQPGA